jgi:hypothetical protein
MTYQPELCACANIVQRRPIKNSHELKRVKVSHSPTIFRSEYEPTRGSDPLVLSARPINPDRRLKYTINLFTMPKGRTKATRRNMDDMEISILATFSGLTTVPKATKFLQGL